MALLGLSDTDDLCCPYIVVTSRSRQCPKAAVAVQVAVKVVVAQEGARAAAVAVAAARRRTRGLVATGPALQGARQVEEEVMPRLPGTASSPYGY